MHHHAVVVGVSAVAVGVPIRLFDVEFHVAADQPQAFNFQQCVPEVRASGHPGAARIDHPNPLAGLRTEAGLPCSTLFPELGQQPLGDLFPAVLSDRPG